MIAANIAEDCRVLRILIVDDHPLIRKGIATELTNRGRGCLVGEASSGAEAIYLARQESPDIVVMDVGLPDLDGLEATREILRARPTTKIVALSCFNDAGHISAMFRAGATAYVTKDSAMTDLNLAIEAVLSDRLYTSPSISKVIKGHDITDVAQSEEGPLTPREREVLKLLADGQAMKEIARTLHLSVKTIETHRKSMMEKLQLYSVAQLTKHAVKTGLSPLD